MHSFNDYRLHATKKEQFFVFIAYNKFINFISLQLASVKNVTYAMLIIFMDSKQAVASVFIINKFETDFYLACTIPKEEKSITKKFYMIHSDSEYFFFLLKTHLQQA